MLCHVHFAEMKEIIDSACLSLHRNIFSMNHDSHLKNTFDLHSACSLVMWSNSRLVPYSSQKKKASWRRDFKICCAGGRWCFEQQVLVQRKSKNRTLLYHCPCYGIIQGIFFFVILRRAKLLAHDWSWGCLAIAYAIEKSLLKPFWCRRIKRRERKWKHEEKHGVLQQYFQKVGQWDFLANLKE